MELIHIKGNTYCITSPTNVGIFKINDKDIYLIDSGNDSDAGRKILNIIKKQGWNIIGIINTHSNADHIGGNNFIQKRTNCKIYSSNIENAFINYPILESSLLYGGYPFNDLRKKFLLAEPSSCDIINNIENLEVLDLKGHFINMIGIKTIDNVYFLGDSLFSENVINKYKVFYIYNIEQYLNTLDYLENLDGIFIASHVNITNDIKSLISLNRNTIYEIIDFILSCCNKICFDDLLKKLFDNYNLIMNNTQYALISSTLRSYLSYLYDLNKIEIIIEDNKLFYNKK